MSSQTNRYFARVSNKQDNAMPPILFDRRTAIGMLGSPVAVPLVLPWLAGSGAAAAATNETIKVLYRKESATSAERTDPIVEAATRALEDELLKNGFRVLQPSTEAYRHLDRGPGAIVTFAADAGFSMLLSLRLSVRPRPGSDTGFVDVQLRSRVFVGANVLSVDQGAGAVMVNMAPETREIAQRMGAEEAARKAAITLVAAATRRLRAIDPAKLAEMNRLGPIKDIYETLPAPSATPVLSDAPTPASTAPTTSTSTPVASVNEPLPPPTRRFALVITMSDYSGVRKRTGSTVTDLPGVKKDKENLIQTLRQLGFPEGNIFNLADDQADGRSVLAAITRLQGAAQEDDLVVLAISGHGAAKDATASGFGMPVLADYDPKAREGLLDFWTLQSLIGNMRARRTVMLLDTCHAGGAALNLGSSTVVTAAGVVVQTNPQDATRMASVMGEGRHFAVIAAARADQSSLDSKDGGVFTLVLLDAMRKSSGQPLARLFAEKVEKQVSENALKASSHATKQNPVFAFKGRGDMIRM